MEQSDITNWPGRSEAARILRCSSELIGQLMNSGRLRFVPTKLGKLIDPADLERVRREREAKGAAA